MEITNAVAGTLESGDIMIQIAPGDGLQVSPLSSAGRSKRSSPKPSPGSASTTPM